METYSDDMTSPDYISSPRGTYCTVCKLSDSKIESNLQNCRICLMDYCDSCSSSSHDQCILCSTYLTDLSIQVSQTLHTLNHQNLCLSSHLLRNPQVSEEILKQDSENQSFVRTQLKDSLSQKKSELIELDLKIEELTGKVNAEKNKKESQNRIRKMNTSEIFIVNSRLKEVIKEVEGEQAVFSFQVMQALEVLKVQNEGERKERSEIEKEKEKQKEKEREREKKEIVVGIKAGEGSAEGYKETAKGLQEELNIVKQNLKKFKKVGSGFETLNQEEDPAGPNCKCIIH